MGKISNYQKKNDDLELMTRKLEESHQKCCELEKQLATYKLNEEQNSNKIEKLTEEKEQAIKFALKLQKKLGECEFELEENTDEKCCELEKKLAAYELNDEQKSNEIHKLIEEKEQASKYAQEYKNKLGEFESKFKEYQDEKNKIIGKLQSDLSEQNERLNEIIQEKSNEINFLKLKSNKYEVVSNYHIVTLEQYTDSGDNNQIEQTMLNLEQESNNNMSSCESDTHSDQSDDETTSKV
jgi:DNA repair exonuclease SbcCD ATPase subunit